MSDQPKSENSVQTLARWGCLLATGLIVAVILWKMATGMVSAIAPPKSRLRKWLAAKLKCPECAVPGMVILAILIWGACAILVGGIIYAMVTN